MLKGSMTKWFFFKTAITTATATTSPAATSASAAFLPRATAWAAVDAAWPAHSLATARTTRTYSGSSRNSATSGRTSLFESMRTGYYRNTNSDEISLDKLLEKAASVRSCIQHVSPPIDLTVLNDSERLFFDSSYDASRGKQDESRMTTRGFCNWILPGTIMVGQYPGRFPETSTPVEEEIREHLKRVLFSKGNESTVTRKEVCFVSLQSELPPQDDFDSWNQNDGEIYLGDPASRQEWPNPFSHYAQTVDSVLADTSSSSSSGDLEVTVRYLHHPIQDLSVPSNSKNLRLLLWKILDFVEGSHNSNTAKQEQRMVYIHCWGGRGRAGLTASCLLTLLEFSAPTRGDPLGAQAVLDLVQTGYASRLGSEHMPLALSRSPQTESQREFVRKFYDEVQAEASKR